MRCRPQHDWPELKYAPSTMFSTACARFGVVTHVHRIAAAELEPHADEAAGRRALHRVTAGHRAGEGDEVDARILHDPFRRRVIAACSTWNSPSGSPAAASAFGETLGAQWRLRRVLQDDRIAGHQRRHDAVHRDQVRVVPGRDREHDAERLATHEADEAGLRPRIDVGERVRGDTDHVSRALQRAAHLVRGIPQRAAHLPSQFLRDLVPHATRMQRRSARVWPRDRRRARRASGAEPRARPSGCDRSARRRRAGARRTCSRRRG